ncbi:MAG: hypothetical protein WEB13_11025 [Dehalococcoidia bacterium]
MCPEQPERFFAVGQFYDHFEPTTEDEVRDLLTEARGRRVSA